MNNLEVIDICHNDISRLPNDIVNMTSLKRFYYIGNKNLMLTKEQEIWIQQFNSAYNDLPCERGEEIYE